MTQSADKFSQKTREGIDDFVVAGFYGLGGARAGDNPTLQALVHEAGGRLFHFWQKRRAIRFLLQEAAKGKRVVIYGYSLGGQTAVSVVNNLAGRGVPVSLLVTFDPYCFSDGSELYLKHNNLAKCINFYQRNARTGPRFGWWGANPYWGSPVVSPHLKVEQIDLTGEPGIVGAAVTHLNIIRCAHGYGWSDELQFPQSNSGNAE